MSGGSNWRSTAERELPSELTALYSLPCAVSNVEYDKQKAVK